MEKTIPQDQKIYTMVVATWMVLLIVYGILTLFGVFR